MRKLDVLDQSNQWPSKHHFPSTFQEIHETHFYQLICRRPRISQNTTFRKTGLVKRWRWLTFDSLQEATTILEWVQRLSKLKCQSWIYYLDYKHTVFIFDQVTFAWEWVYTPSLPPLSPPTSWICLSMTSFGVDLLFPSEIWIWIVFVSLSDLCSTNQM